MSGIMLNGRRIETLMLVSKLPVIDQQVVDDVFCDIKQPDVAVEGFSESLLDKLPKLKDVNLKQFRLFYTAPVEEYCSLTRPLITMYEDAVGSRLNRLFCMAPTVIYDGVTVPARRYILDIISADEAALFHQWLCRLSFYTPSMYCEVDINRATYSDMSTRANIYVCFPRTNRWSIRHSLSTPLQTMVVDCKGDEKDMMQKRLIACHKRDVNLPALHGNRGKIAEHEEIKKWVVD